MSYEKHFNLRETSQSQPIPGSNQQQNNAGGYSFTVTPRVLLDRFLILGAEGGTYYVGERELTVQNATNVLNMIQNGEGITVVRAAVNVSERGRAPKNDPALFVLALCTGATDPKVRKAAWESLPRVARTGTHLFQFAKYRKAVGGWGRLARTGIANWYREKSPEKLAYQVLKYKNREGWTHRDLLRLSHATGDEQHNAIFQAVTHPDKASDNLPRLFEGVTRIQEAPSAEAAAMIVRDYGLTREMVPTEYLNDPVVYEALFEKMPMTAMVRNLGNMSKMGLLTPMSVVSKEVVARLRDEDRVRKARLHPLNLLSAIKTYASGQGRLGKGTWTVVPQVVDALDDALMLSFDTVEPTGKRFVFGVDVSGSMSWPSPIPGITCAEAAAVMALVGAKTEPEYFIGGFSTQFKDLKITAKDSFESALRKTSGIAFGGTDCAVPMLHALKQGVEADMFEVITDNETWAGRIHPSQALDQYRQKTGIPAKLVVVGMVSNKFTIADPNDAGMLDVVGMDTSVPAVISSFAAS